MDYIKNINQVPMLWKRMPFIWLGIAMLMGIVLRYFHIEAFSFINYTKLLHAHTHTAMLGWVFSAITVLAAAKLFPGLAQLKWMRLWFLAVQFSVLGMAVSFPLQGYAFWSILFSSLHMLLFYFFFGYCFLKYGFKENRMARVVFFSASAFMLISSIGPWGLGILSAKGLQAHPLYALSVQFFLQFLIEGWFILALIAILLADVKDAKLTSAIPSRLIGYSLSLILLFSLNILNYYTFNSLEVLALAGALLQLLVIASIYKYKNAIKAFIDDNYQLKYLLGFCLFLFGLKASLQFIAALPFTDPFIISIQPFRIAYLHLVLIGIISTFIIMLYAKAGWINIKGSTFKYALGVFVFSFSIHTAMLFLQGMFLWLYLRAIPYNAEILFITAAGMLAGILFIQHKIQKPIYSLLNSK